MPNKMMCQLMKMKEIKYDVFKILLVYFNKVCAIVITKVIEFMFFMYEG